MNLGLPQTQEDADTDRRFIDGVNESLGAGLGLVAAIRKQVRREKAAAYNRARFQARKAAEVEKKRI